MTKRDISANLVRNVWFFVEDSTKCALKYSLVSHFSSWKSLTYWNQVGGVWKRVSCHGNRIFIATGVFPVELWAYQVSMVCAANWPSSFIYLLYNIGLSVWCHQSSHLHILSISGTNADIWKVNNILILSWNSMWCTWKFKG